MDDFFESGGVFGKGISTFSGCFDKSPGFPSNKRLLAFDIACIFKFSQVCTEIAIGQF